MIFGEYASFTPTGDSLLVIVFSRIKTRIDHRERSHSRKLSGEKLLLNGVRPQATWKPRLQTKHFRLHAGQFL